MKSRAEIDKEARTMQFVVERHCPIVGKAPAIELPIVVWVLLAQPGFEGDRYDCGVRQYVVPHDQAKAVRDQYAAETLACDYRVCEHMGHLIE